MIYCVLVPIPWYPTEATQKGGHHSTMSQSDTRRHMTLAMAMLNKGNKETRVPVLIWQ